jgi:c-di-GMP-binding flagellar brake protein YcgR
VEHILERKNLSPPTTVKGFNRNRSDPMTSKRKLKANQTTRLHIELATDLFLRFKGKKGFFPSYLIGMKPDAFLIIKTPAIINPENPLSEGASISVRYSYLGDIYNFKSTVIGTNEKPFKVTYLAYPDLVEKIEHRNSPRVCSYIPASLIWEKMAVKGIITDISLGGCKFRTDSMDQMETLLIKRESHVILHFPLLGLEGIKEFTGKIKKVEFDNDYSLGIGFREIDEESRKVIASFVEGAIEYRDK